MNRKLIGEYLKATREEKNITQDQLTKKTGLTRAQIIALEKGTLDYRIDTLIKYLKGIKFKVAFESNDSRDKVDVDDSTIARIKKSAIKTSTGYLVVGTPGTAKKRK